MHILIILDTGVMCDFNATLVNSQTSVFLRLYLVPNDGDAPRPNITQPINFEFSQTPI